MKPAPAGNAEPQLGAKTPHANLGLGAPSLPPGYKQTVVGVIPEEWEAVQLQGKISIVHGFAFASQHFASHGPYRLATPGHFCEAGGFRDVGEKQKYYAGHVPSDYVLKPGDVIVAMTEQADGLLGSAAVIPNEHGYLHNQRLGRVRTLSSEIELSYLVNVFNSPAYRAKVRETAAGTKVKHTSPGKLLEIFVRLPSPPEQRAVAAVLSDVDGLLGRWTGSSPRSATLNRPPCSSSSPAKPASPASPPGTLSPSSARKRNAPSWGLALPGRFPKAGR